VLAEQEVRTRVTLIVPSLVDALHTELREQILSGRIAAGAPLTEIDLATRYSVARPTAKAAVERLVHEGLLKRATNKTARVPLLGIADIRDLYFTRGLLEREVIAALCRRRLVPEPARQSMRAMRDLAADPSLADVVGADVLFHQSLVEAMGSPRLNRLYASLMGEVRLCMAQVQAHHLLKPARIAAEHSRILAAIESGDEATLLLEIDAHLDAACERLVSYLEPVANDRSIDLGSDLSS
jgi:DNA-binding GntR family transcriptional regulator